MEKVKTKISNHYNSGYEDQRLRTGVGLLENARMQLLVKRFLPNSPAKILDAGGGTGVYTFWLSRMGYRVSMIDITPLHVRMAKAYAAKNKKYRPEFIDEGDARSLSFDDGSFDVVIMFGPLYHLTKSNDRHKSLQEARRVLRKGGTLMTATISKYASLLDGIRYDFLEDAAFRKIVERDLESGQHQNPTGKAEYFMETFFHDPDGVRNELAAAGFKNIVSYGVQGPCWMMHPFEEHWKKRKNFILKMAEKLERDKNMIAMSPHLFTVAVK